MPSVFEVLRQSGFSDSEIRELDGRVLGAASNVLEAAENVGRSNTEFYEGTIAPALVNWGNEREQLEAAKADAERRARYYEAAAREAGILPNESTPGTPTFTDNPSDFVAKASMGLAQISDIYHKHQMLYGKPLEALPSQIISAADRMGISPNEYANRTFKFDEMERKRHDDQIRREAEERVRREYGEKFGSNPDTRLPSGSAKYAEAQRAVKAGELKDPTRLSPQARRAQALRSIHKAIEERQEREGA